MSEVQVPEIARKLARRYDVKGRSVAPTLSPELVPVILADDLSSPAQEDTGFLRRCFGGDLDGPTAAQFSHVQIFNPADSGIVIELEGFLAHFTTASSGRIRTDDTARATLGTSKAFRDRRIEGEPVGEIRNESNAAAQGSVISGPLGLPANESAIVPFDGILLPGQGYSFVGDAVNIGIRLTWYWLERSLLVGE